jgi:hypothetical protein
MCLAVLARGTPDAKFARYGRLRRPGNARHTGAAPTGAPGGRSLPAPPPAPPYPGDVRPRIR